MEEKRIITKEQFDEAVKGAIEAMFNDKRLEGESRFMTALAGTVFAAKVREILFEENKVENEELNESDIRESKSDN